MTNLANALAEWERAMLSERKDWVARQRMLSRRPDYQRLEALSHDLRNGDPLSMEFLPFKRDYRNAVTWWLMGSLRPMEFFARVRAFESAAQREFARREAYEISLTYWNKDYQRFVRSWNRSGFVSRVGWDRLVSQRRRSERCLVERQQRQATAKQRAFLRQGQSTMRTIRRVLRGQEPLPQPEFTPAKSLQTS